MIVHDAAGAPRLVADLTELPNANAQATLTFTVEQRCDMGHWHTVVTPIPIPPYDYA